MDAAHTSRGYRVWLRGVLRSPMLLTSSATGAVKRGGGSRTSGFRAGWGDAYGHCLVATGKIELMLDPIVSVWDCGPFPPILREAGGYFGDWAGSATIHAGEALSTTQALLPEVLRLVEGPA